MKLADKLEKLTKKMVKNYLPFVYFEGKILLILAPNDKKRGPGPKKDGAKKVSASKIPPPEQPKTYEDRQ